jgi:hypothetical protein
VVPDQRSQTAHLQTKVQNNEIEANKQNTQNVTFKFKFGVGCYPKLLSLADSQSGLANARRFDKVIYLLPAKRKRFELFKFYSQVGVETV